MTTNVLKKGWFNPISISVLLILIAISICLYLLQIVNVALFVLLLIIAVLLASSIRIADQWERAVVLRMGKFCGLKGPGPFMIVPILDSVSTYIDQRVRVSAFKAEQTLTKDTVPVNVDAVVYWTVWDVEKAALEVQEYQTAIEHIAQTGLRDTIGKHELSDLLQERDKIAEAGLEIVSAELEMIAQQNIDLPDDKYTSFMKMLDNLEENDDVQNVYHNVNLRDENE